jgi:hypothetical protein
LFLVRLDLFPAPNLAIGNAKNDPVLFSEWPNGRPNGRPNGCIVWRCVAVRMIDAKIAGAVVLPGQFNGFVGSLWLGRCNLRRAPLAVVGCF